MAEQKNDIALIKKDTVDVVADKVKTFQEKGELHFPVNYSPENAMKSAWLTLQNTQDRNYKPALEVCTRDSVANALLDMVVQGLNPSKKQGYFIVYGNQLTFQRSYFGTMAVTQRVTGAKSIDAAVIYEGDEVNYEIKNGQIKNLTHKQQFNNIDKEKVSGAYCTIEMGDGSIYTELMTIDEIRQSWSQSKMWGKDQKKEKAGSTHDNFKQEMAKKTVINRTCKKFMNSSDDGSLVMNHFHHTDDAAEEARMREEVNQNANQEIIDIEPGPATPEKEPIPEAQKEEQPEQPQSNNQEEQLDLTASFEQANEAVAAGTDEDPF
ncbi:recombination protein RecT [Salibacterium salarium]|uniref:recombinase RecT n=1 Tax=Salibacterium salarium TaxID=284579 RepID=UPI00277D569F|nr:recombinase RecT [Salibacterium salarium]MDQ0299679.1 recombination protein RecT [Salibacterium salarium]